MAISTIRPGRAYYPSQQSASASSDSDPYEWTTTLAPGDVLLVGGGGLGGVYAGDAVKVPTGYTARNVVIQNFSSLVDDYYIKFGKSLRDILETSAHAMVTARGPFYSQGDFDQFVIYNPTAQNILVTTQWDATGVPVSSNAGHPGHGSATLDLSSLIGAAGTKTIALTWGRNRRITKLAAYTSTGLSAAGVTASILVDGVSKASQSLNGIVTGTLLDIPVTQTDVTRANNVQLVLSGPAQAAGRNLFVEVTYEFI